MFSEINEIATGGFSFDDVDEYSADSLGHEPISSLTVANVNNTLGSLFNKVHGDTDEHAGC